MCLDVGHADLWSLLGLRSAKMNSLRIVVQTTYLFHLTGLYDLIDPG